MLGFAGAIGALIFIVGLLLLGLSGARTWTRGWVGPAGTALIAIGLGVEVVAGMGS
jgi:hypothetical protein